MPHSLIRRLIVAVLIVAVLYPTRYDLAVSVNQFRYEAGVPYLAGDWTLDRYAQAHAETLAARGVIFHSDIWQLTGSWSHVGENVGTGPTLWTVLSAFRSSPSHAQNLYGDWTHLGVGVAFAAGRLYVVTVFAR